MFVPIFLVIIHFVLRGSFLLIMVVYEKHLLEKNLLNEALNCTLTYIETRRSAINDWNISIQISYVWLSKNLSESRKEIMKLKGKSILTVVGPSRFENFYVYQSYTFGLPVPHLAPLFSSAYSNDIYFPFCIKMTQPYKTDEVIIYVKYFC